MNYSFPSTSDQTPWPAALFSLLPFVIAGPVRIFLSYQPGWMPGQGSLWYLLFLLLSFLVFAAGLALGMVKRFPRWAYPYAISLGFALYLLAGYGFFLIHIDLTWQNNFILYVAATLLILWLPPFRSFYQRIPEDWTLLSYGLYGFVLFFLAQLDFEESPRLTLPVLLPSILGLCAALAHLRIRSASMRIATLLVGSLAGLFFWVFPLFSGMVSTWIGIMVGMGMLVGWGIFLAVFILAPVVLVPAIQTWRASRRSSL